MHVGGDVTQNALGTIKRTAQFTINEHPGIAWESDLFRLFARIDGESYPLGVFIPSSPIRAKPYTSFIRTIDGYDLTLILSDDRVTDRLLLRAGQPYTEIIGDLILSAGLVRFDIDASSEVIPVDKEYEAGTQKITIINELLEEINFNSLYADASGRIIARRYVFPGERPTTRLYKADEYSIIRPGLSTSLDFFGLPNIFIAIVSSPELPTMRAEFINDNPSSMLSTIRRKRKIVAAPEVLSSSPSQGALQGYVERLAAETSQVFEHVAFDTAINPVHSTNEMIELHHPDTGISRYAETFWRIPMKAGEAMEHQGRRVVTL